MEMRDEVPNREKHKIQSPKLMLTFVWNPHGFQVVDVMLYHTIPYHAMPYHTIPYHAIPKGEMLTSSDYIGNILTEIVARRGER
jgi:hypothetical protein